MVEDSEDNLVKELDMAAELADKQNSLMVTLEAKVRYWNQCMC